ncbi:uncharacterized protein VTP21DRAFT_948 [Calcarisporiella thermophila]|uniref:uncharacterized protein n=1 Tax=Calcarisporiella thermophila TaxID=911321 RepID=UPI0037447CBA
MQSPILDAYVRGTLVWIPIKDQEGDEEWVACEILSKHISEGQFRLVAMDEKGKEHVIESSIENGELPPLRNPPHLELIDDLTQLTHLNEPSVLHAIESRYAKQNIYTYSGIVLIAVNPFERVDLYGPETVKAYSGARRGELPPHLFAIAEDAFRCMLREKQNQTIVVSGESGAGKTMSAKYIMRYFASAEDHALGDGAVTVDTFRIEKQILATNPIMEAFGNAKTTRNDNSSRFGKYIKIQFDEKANIVGAKINTYLLERSRLVYQPDTERNYHIFYQLCDGADESLREELSLERCNRFHYLNQGGVTTIPGVDDARDFEATRSALLTVGIGEDVQHDIFRLLAALLHVGNIHISGRNEALIAEDDPHLHNASRLLGIQPGEFRKWIMRRQIATRSERIVTALNPAQAVVIRDSAVKYVYVNLFDWLVNVINEGLSRAGAAERNFIGVLDIYGFEHFKKNSFEQLCINYANEKLQQEFNAHVFRLEQEEYIQEQIDWTFIEFADNQACIEMIEGRLGILPLLDEESRLPSGSDQGLCTKLYQQFTDAPNFRKPRFGGGSAFTIAHYAHEVTYDAEGFLEKNRDTLPDEHLTLLQSTDFNFLRKVLSSGAVSPPVNKRASIAAKKPTLGSIFRQSLIGLMELMRSTNVLYIRCVKPNVNKNAWEFDRMMVLSQLRACGVLETIRISCAGYPARWLYSEFLERFGMLLPAADKTAQHLSLKDKSLAILDVSRTNHPDQYRLGKTKIFLRTTLLAVLEGRRSEKLDSSAVVLQKHVRSFLCRRRYLRIRGAIMRLQCCARRYIARQHLRAMREERAAVTLQKVWKGYRARKQYCQQRSAVLQLQRVFRGHVQRKRFVAQRHAAIRVQSLYRGWIARRHYTRCRKQIIRSQSYVRGFIARKERARLEEIRANEEKERRKREKEEEEKKLLKQKEQQELEERQKAMEAAANAERLALIDSLPLPNRVAEISITLAHQKKEKEELKLRASRLETRVRSWIDKYARLERVWQEVEEAYASVQSPRRSRGDLGSAFGLRPDTPESNESISSLGGDEELLQLHTELQRKKAELARLRTARSAPSSPSSPRLPGSLQRQYSVSGSPDTDVSRLKREIARLKAEMSINRRHSHKPPANGINGVGFEAVHALSRHASVAGIVQVNGHHAQKNPYKGVRHLYENPTGELAQFLEQEGDSLRDEIVEELVRGCKHSLPTAPPAPSHELLFPARVVALSLILLSRLNLTRDAEHLLAGVIGAIQEQCLHRQGDEAILAGAYWLRNAIELHSQIGAEMGSKHSGVAAMKHEIKRLIARIHGGWTGELRRFFTPMIVPAVVECQSLPYFVTSTNGHHPTQMATPDSSPVVGSFDMTEPATTETLLKALHRLWKIVKGYGLEDVGRRAILMIIKTIGVLSFNELLERESFCSWKRAMQIQHNLLRIEEWCKGHVPDACLHLEPVMQATKLLQLKKATVDDIGVMSELCWALTPAQVHRLVSRYHVADYENPIAPEVLEALASRVQPGDQLALALPESEEEVALDGEVDRAMMLSDEYIPRCLKLGQVRRLMHLSSSLVEVGGK